MASESRPAWGAWIETDYTSAVLAIDNSRAPHGARGLKRHLVICKRVRLSRAPHGARGLKQSVKGHPVLRQGSRPAWGAWIETRP